MPVMQYIEAVRETLREEMRHDPRVFVMGEDVGKRGGVFRATMGLAEEFGEQRVIDTPLTEAAIVGVGVGAALAGMRPVCEIQFADFIWPAMNQIVSEAAKMRYRTAGDWFCPLVIRTPYGGGVHGGLYHSQSIEAHFAHLMGLKICAPGTPADVRGLLRSSIRDDDPVLFLEHKGLYRAVKGEVPEGDYTTPIGQADVKRDGGDITVFSYGKTLHFCLEAADRIAAQEGIQAMVVDLRTLLPLDKETVCNAAARTGKVLIVHEDNATMGVGAEVAALIAENVLFELDAPVRRLCGPDIPQMPYSSPLEKFYMLSPETIAEGMKQLAYF